MKDKTFMPKMILKEDLLALTAYHFMYQICIEDHFIIHFISMAANDYLTLVVFWHVRFFHFFFFNLPAGQFWLDYISTNVLMSKQFAQVFHV